MHYDIMFIKNFNGLLENSSFCIQFFGFDYSSFRIFDIYHFAEARTVFFSRLIDSNIK